MVSSEAAPLAKTGGLADVVGALPAALRDYGEEVAVVIPRYGSIDLKNARRVFDHMAVHFGPDRYDLAIYQAPEEYPLYLVDCPPLYDRDGFYGEAGLDYPDNHMRFAVFARAALGVARGLFPRRYLPLPRLAGRAGPRLPAHHLRHRPDLPRRQDPVHHSQPGLPGPLPKPASCRRSGSIAAVYRPGGMEFFGQVSYIKGGIAFADALSTVSPTYAREIQTPEYGFGLDGALRARAGVLTGILNGADYREWSPETDPLIPARYSVDDLCGKGRLQARTAGRDSACRRKPPERPLLGVVSRFTPPERQPTSWPKWRAASSPKTSIWWRSGRATRSSRKPSACMAAEHPGRIAVRIGFDNALAHRIEAGADMFLMPSRYEPCGLNQIYSLRYGTVPVVRATGGLDDTIEEGTGFKFAEYSGAALLEAVRKAVGVYSDQDAWREMMRRGMQKDFSWKTSAGAYSALYRKLLGRG